MTVIDPSLDAGPGASGGRLPEGRDVAMLRHDIRGALQGVIGGIGQIDAAGLDARTREQVDRVAAAAQTLRALVCAVLGDEPGPDETRPVDVAGFLRYVRRRHGGEASERGLVLEAAAEPGVPDGLRLDLIPLARIADNLIGNAIKFSKAGTVRLSVAQDPDGALIVRVADDGPGLAAAPAAGEPDRSGEGLGLKIVRSLAAGLGGEVQLANRPSGGAEATVRIPAGSVAAAARGDSSAPDLAGLHVLLAEDNPTNQMVASQMLRSLNARVTVCNDGVEALECFESEPADLVVVDIEMPRLSGLDVIRAIRARSDARGQVPIVALTAYAMREHRERIAAAGANGLISKPITSVDALGRGLAAHVAPLLRRSAPAMPAAPVSAPGAAPAGPVIDLGIFDALCAAIGPDTMDELLDKVITDLLSAQRELAAALDPLERASIRGASHILISVAGALGAVRLEACARLLNAAAHSDPPEQVVPGVRGCIAEIDDAVAFARERRGLR